MRQMVQSFLAFIALSLLAHAAAGADLVLATKFDPVFRINQIEKRCLILKPGEAPGKDELGAPVYPDARDKRAYPYGSRVMTVPDGGAVIKFSPPNEVVLGGGVNLVVGEDPKNTNAKILNLEQGKIAVTLEKGVEDVGNSVTVLTPSGAKILATTVTTVAIDVQTLSDRVNTSVMVSDGGTCRIQHPNLFDIFLMAGEKGKEQAISIVSSLDNNFIRVQNDKGTFGIKVRNPPDPELAGEAPNDAVVDAELEIFEGLPHETGFKIWKLLPDMSVKFSQRKVEPGNFLLVTMLLATANGNFQQEISYRYDVGQGKAIGMSDVQAPAVEAVDAGAPVGGVEAGIPAAATEGAPKADAAPKALPAAKADDLLPLD